MADVNPKGLALFDCDGTLVDSQHLIVDAFQKAAHAAQVRIPEAAEVRMTIGLSLDVALERLFPDTLDRDDIREAYCQIYHEWRKSNVLEPLYSGIRDALVAFRDQGWLLGVATGKSMAGLRHVLKAHGILDEFVTLQTADIARSKPDPDMVERAMIETGLDDPKRVVVIGDTSYDMTMAQSAGAFGVGVLWGYHNRAELEAAGASFIAKEVDTLLPFASDLIS